MLATSSVLAKRPISDVGRCSLTKVRPAASRQPIRDNAQGLALILRQEFGRAGACWGTLEPASRYQRRLRTSGLTIR
jgi:hypothetical protein